MKKKIVISGMQCMHCSSRVEKVLLALGGKQVSVSHESGIATGDFTVDDETLKKAVEEIGFDVIRIE